MSTLGNIFQNDIVGDNNIGFDKMTVASETVIKIQEVTKQKQKQIRMSLPGKHDEQRTWDGFFLSLGSDSIFVPVMWINNPYDFHSSYLEIDNDVLGAVYKLVTRGFSSTHRRKYITRLKKLGKDLEYIVNTAEAAYEKIRKKGGDPCCTEEQFDIEIEQLNQMEPAVRFIKSIMNEYNVLFS
jgi:hypothetical protein